MTAYPSEQDARDAVAERPELFEVAYAEVLGSVYYCRKTLATLASGDADTAEVYSAWARLGAALTSVHGSTHMNGDTIWRDATAAEIESSAWSSVRSTLYQERQAAEAADAGVST